jgi:L-2-hydroxyglutarate oxidase
LTKQARREFEVAVIGGGIVGMAAARALLAKRSGLNLVVLEKEERLAAHQTGHNSGVIHSGLYYRPGSLKARNCVAGRDALYHFCEQTGLPFERCGKVVVATREEELSVLEELERRGRANGLDGLQRLTTAELCSYEPQAAGIAGLYVPQTGIVDYVRVTEAFAAEVKRAGGEVRTASRVRGIRRGQGGFILDTPWGAVRCRSLVNCAGLHSDRIARLAGAEPAVRIIPFRGEYYKIVPARRMLVKNLIYPVPDPAFPFLGVHFTRMIDGEREAGPNAVLALKREGYGRISFSLRDTWETLSFPGFWHLAGRFWRQGWEEYRRSLSKRAFLQDLQRLLPALKNEDIHRGGAGVRAQAVDREGRLLDDFHILEGEGMIHVLNAPSPAATASISIGRTIADKAAQSFGFG